MIVCWKDRSEPRLATWQKNPLELLCSVRGVEGDDVLELGQFVALNVTLPLLRGVHLRGNFGQHIEEARAPRVGRRDDGSYSDLEIVFQPLSHLLQGVQQLPRLI